MSLCAAIISCIQPGTIRDSDLGTLGLPNAIPVVYEFERDGSVRCGVEGRCYVPPIEGYYLGDATRIKQVQQSIREQLVSEGGSKGDASGDGSVLPEGESPCLVTTDDGDEWVCEVRPGEEEEEEERAKEQNTPARE